MASNFGLWDVLLSAFGFTMICVAWAADKGCGAWGKVMGLADLEILHLEIEQAKWAEAEERMNRAFRTAQGMLELNHEIDRSYRRQLDEMFVRGQQELVGVFQCIGCDGFWPRNWPDCRVGGALELCAECVHDGELPMPARSPVVQQNTLMLN